MRYGSRCSPSTGSPGLGEPGLPKLCNNKEWDRMRNITNIVIASVLFFTQSANAEILCVYRNASLQCLRAARDVFSVPLGAGFAQHQPGQGGLNATGPFNGGTWRWNFTGGFVSGRHWCTNSAMTANGVNCFCQIINFNGISCVNRWTRITSEGWYAMHGTLCTDQCAIDCADTIRIHLDHRKSVISMTCVACNNCATECGAGWAPAPINAEMYTPRSRNCPNRPRGSGTVTCQ